MAVLINFKICDNAKECNGIAVCPTGALSWDGKNKTVSIDNSKCISCMKCEKACMVGAIKVSKTKEEYERLQKEIDDDSRKRSDLYIDRYGAQPIHPAFLIPQEKFQKEVEEENKLIIAEIFNSDSIMCLLRSIPIRELTGNVDVKYRKVELKNKDIQKRYKIKKLPALLVFEKKKLIGKIEGYFDTEHKGELEKQLKNIISKI